jgi:hypothetical protein
MVWPRPWRLCQVTASSRSPLGRPTVGIVFLYPPVITSEERQRGWLKSEASQNDDFVNPNA